MLSLGACREVARIIHPGFTPSADDRPDELAYIVRSLHAIDSVPPTHSRQAEAKHSFFATRQHFACSACCDDHVLFAWCNVHDSLKAAKQCSC